MVVRDESLKSLAQPPGRPCAFVTVPWVLPAVFPVLMRDVFVELMFVVVVLEFAVFELAPFPSSESGGTQMAPANEPAIQSRRMPPTESAIQAGALAKASIRPLRASTSFAGSGRTCR